jgi:hypothetical protein
MLINTGGKPAGKYNRQDGSGAPAGNHAHVLRLKINCQKTELRPGGQLLDVSEKDLMTKSQKSNPVKANGESRRLGRKDLIIAKIRPVTVVKGQSDRKTIDVGIDGFHQIN